MNRFQRVKEIIALYSDTQTPTKYRVQTVKKAGTYENYFLVLKG
jgi:hypothetical protein